MNRSNTSQYDNSASTSILQSKAMHAHVRVLAGAPRQSSSAAAGTAAGRLPAPVPGGHEAQVLSAQDLCVEQKRI